MNTHIIDSDLIPPQTQGGQSNTSHIIQPDSERDAAILFKEARRKLLDVNHWRQISGGTGAAFTLVDKNGQVMYRNAQEGDYIRINIPGPGSDTGNGYDWVQIERITGMDSKQGMLAYLGMRVRPLPVPDKAGHHVAHFFKNYATSSFIVEKTGNLLKASVYGRNEVPNVTVNKWWDKIRNLFTAIGAILGLSKLQWKNLAKGFLGQS